MEWATWAVKPAASFLYVVIVLEILFMISPFALYFYAAYGPTLNVLHASAWTAWLTQFFLPHVAHTRSVVLDGVPVVAGVLVVSGALIFLAGAVPLYWAKLCRQSLVTGGAYAVVRHPQYVGLAVLGLGTLLIWPRFLAALIYVTMLFLYLLLARLGRRRMPGPIRGQLPHLPTSNRTLRAALDPPEASTAVAGSPHAALRLGPHALRARVDDHPRPRLLGPGILPGAAHRSVRGRSGGDIHGCDPRRRGDCHHAHRRRRFTRGRSLERGRLWVWRQVSHSLLHLGIALWVDSLWVLGTLVVAAVPISCVVVPRNPGSRIIAGQSPWRQAQPPAPDGAPSFPQICSRR